MVAAAFIAGDATGSGAAAQEGPIPGALSLQGVPEEAERSGERERVGCERQVAQATGAVLSNLVSTRRLPGVGAGLP